MTVYPSRTEFHSEVEALPSPAYTRYLLVILLILYTLNFVDRQIINILAEPIKQDLKLSDTELGLLTGFSFAIFYSLFGIPLARIADRGHRPRMIAIALACWSGFTVLCGMVASYWQLLLMRMGVAVGEAGLSPAAFSLIFDSVPPEKRSSSVAFYQLGIPLGSLVGLALGGVLAAHYGWRVAFVVAGLPGLLLSVLVILTLREPRHEPAFRKLQQASRATLRETIVFLSRKPSFWFLSLAAGLRAFVIYGQGPFLGSFLYRVHGDQVAQIAASWGVPPTAFVGVALGIIIGVTGAIGTFVGGYVGDRLAARDVRGYASFPALSTLAAVPLFITAFLANDLVVVIALLFVGNTIGTMYMAPVHAAVLSLPTATMRGTTSALLLLVISLIGLGLGPLTTGIISDVVNHNGFGPAEGIRWALIITGLAGFAVAALFWAARAHIARDLEV